MKACGGFEIDLYCENRTIKTVVYHSLSGKIKWKGRFHLTNKNNEKVEEFHQENEMIHFSTKKVVYILNRIE